MKQYIYLLSFLLLALNITGCGSSGISVASHSTDVQLHKNNYRMVAVNVTGSAESSYLIGGSFSWGAATQSFGLIPLGGTPTLYKVPKKICGIILKNKISRS